MESADDILASASAVLRRSREEGAPPQPPRRRAAGGGPGGRLLRIAAAFVAILLLAGTIGAALGTVGAILVTLLLFATVGALAVWPRDAPTPPMREKLQTVDLRALPGQTDRWLRAQRPQLPAVSQHLLDRIGDRLETLSPQLGRVASDGEEAGEIRRLVGEQLPAFVADYARVPTSLRRTIRGGRTPDAALADGLGVIERELAAITERLARDDLDSLQTRGRYLEARYPGEGGAG